MHANVKYAAVSALFLYFLIAFEFLYMATPFASWIYSAYGPPLDFMASYSPFRELTYFFLPHITSTGSSFIINAMRPMGLVFTLVGLAIFGIGAFQVYSTKIRRCGPVLGGIYRFVRHPQYTGFAMAGLGLLLLWPRYLVLVLYVTMLFAYYILARMEELECERAYGSDYIEYLQATPMFLPLAAHVPPLPVSLSWTRKALSLLAVYVLALATSLAGARALQHLSVDSLFAVLGDRRAMVAMVPMSTKTMELADMVARQSPHVMSLLAPVQASSTDPGILLAYLMPVDFSVSELPLHPVESNTHAHLLGSIRLEGNSIKILYARAIPHDNRVRTSRDMLLSGAYVTPLAEVLVDVEIGMVLNVREPAPMTRYGDLPMPLI